MLYFKYKTTTKNAIGMDDEGLKELAEQLLGYGVYLVNEDKGIAILRNVDQKAFLIFDHEEKLIISDFMQEEFLDILKQNKVSEDKEEYKQLYTKFSNLEYLPEGEAIKLAKEKIGPVIKKIIDTIECYKKTNCDGKKPLLIIVGEDPHYFRPNALIESVLLIYNKGVIKNFFIELCESELKNIYKHFDKDGRGKYLRKAKNLTPDIDSTYVVGLIELGKKLNYNIFAASAEQTKLKDQYKVDTTKIIKTIISNYSQQNSLLIVGGAHLFDLMNNTELLNNFFVVPIYLAVNSSRVNEIYSKEMLKNTKKEFKKLEQRGAEREKLRKTDTDFREEENLLAKKIEKVKSSKGIIMIDTTDIVKTARDLGIKEEDGSIDAFTLLEQISSMFNGCKKELEEQPEIKSTFTLFV